MKEKNIALIFSAFFVFLSLFSANLFICIVLLSFSFFFLLVNSKIELQEEKEKKESKNL